jgi:hypothetical protein
VTRGSWALLAGLLVLGLAVGLLAADPGAGDSAEASIDNRGPRGLAVLAGWLEAQGVRLTRTTGPFGAISPEVKTVVLAAPSTAEVSNEELEVLQRFVRAGGTLVYLAPRGVPQPAMSRWLDLTQGSLAPMHDEPGLVDPAGSTAKVSFRGGLTARVERLRVAADRQVILHRPGAVPVAEPGALWFAEDGAGELWVGSGADLAENARLEALDNARFWSAVGARGPVLFDEYHHQASAALKAPPSLWASGLQLTLCALCFVLVFGARLGPPREPGPRLHRSGAEYVQAMAGLSRRSKVEAELLELVRRQARQLAQERLGVPAAASWSEAAKVVRARLSSAAPAFEALGGSQTFLAASVFAAQFERAVLGLG